jgi:hypothetical protein
MLVVTELGYKQLPFHFYVYFEGSTPEEEPKGIMPGELPQFYMFPHSNRNFSFLWNKKALEEIKREGLGLRV